MGLRSVEIHSLHPSELAVRPSQDSANDLHLWHNMRQKHL